MMSALYDYIDNNDRSYLEQYILLEYIDDSYSTTGVLEVDEDDRRVLSDANKTFSDIEVEDGDTIYLMDTSPRSVSPDGYHYINEVDEDENLLYIDGEVLPIGQNVAYKLYKAGELQGIINNLYRRLSYIKNVDLTNARFMESINQPWYYEVTQIVLNYFAERQALDDNQFVYTVNQSDLDAATLFGNITPPPGPLLYPYGYTSILPDRRNGSASAGLGTPSLIGLPDSGPRTPTPFSPPITDIQSDLGELPAIVEEENFYNTFSYPYTTDDESRLNSIATAITNALNSQISAINQLIVDLDNNVSDLQSRGVTGSAFYANISVAKKNLNTALTNASFHLTDPTEGVPAITTGSSPSPARRNYITSIRPAQIANRVSQINNDQFHWVEQRYVFLAKRVGRSEGSLTLLRRANNELSEVQDLIDFREDERLEIKNVLGV